MRQKCDNYKQVFGTWKCAWVWPLKPKYGYVDGHEYPFDEQLLMKDLEYMGDRERMFREDGARRGGVEEDAPAGAEEEVAQPPYQPPDIREVSERVFSCRGRRRQGKMGMLWGTRTECSLSEVWSELI